MTDMALQRIYANAELADGSVHEDVRILHADRAQYFRTAKARQWDQSDEYQAHTFLTWHALRRTLPEGAIHGYEQFVETQLVDCLVTDQAPEDPTPAEEQKTSA